jgi:hypothetical protein
MQAARLIRAFEAYGIARQQIVRVLPEQIAIPSSAFSSPEELKRHLSSSLLDWASEYLAISRPWLDAIEAHPCVPIDYYKNEAASAEWFQARKELAPDAYRRLLVWATSVPVLG